MACGAAWQLWLLGGPGQLTFGRGVGSSSGQFECRARLEEAGVHLDLGAASEESLQRELLYRRMDASLAGRPLDLGAGATQGMSVGDLFQLPVDGDIVPILHHLDVPVRAVVMPLLNPPAARALGSAVRRHLLPLLPPHGAWASDPLLLHSTIWHASTHLDPVPASAGEVEAEAAAIALAAAAACPVRAVLERVVVTPGGTVLACWQVAAGAEPSALRRALAAALPRASRVQVVNDRSILHTTLARIVRAPQARAAPGGRRGAAGGDGAGAALRAAAAAITRELCGLQVVMDQLWFVQEEDRLALALDGRLTKRNIPLQCGQG